MADHHPKSLQPASSKLPVSRDPVIASLFTEQAPEFDLSIVASSARRENPSPRLVEINNDFMEPTLRRRDVVAVRPCDSFEADGLYLIEVGGSSRIYRCCSDYRSGISLMSDNKLYSSYVLKRGDFEKCVLGRAVAHFRRLV